MNWQRIRKFQLEFDRRKGLMKQVKANRERNMVNINGRFECHLKLNANKHCHICKCKYVQTIYRLGGAENLYHVRTVPNLNRCHASLEPCFKRWP